MKTFFKAMLVSLSVALFITACDKVDSLPFYNTGTAPVAIASSSALTPAATDSDNVALTISWTNPDYASDTATTKYVVQIDSAGRNFSKAVSKTVTGSMSTTFTAKDLNTIALSYGFAFNTAYGMDIRVISSYANNNDQKTSNVITIQYTPYKIPPKVELPPSGRLFITGNATQGDWTNTPPIPSQEFYRVGETTWSGIFKLNAGGGYVILRQYSSWDEKYAVDDNTVSGINTGGTFGYHVGDAYNQNIPGPADAGWYKITLDFQTGNFTVSKLENDLPEALYITGDATQSSWTNTPPTDQGFIRLNSVEYQDTISFVPGKYYKFLSVYGQWQPQFGGDNADSGTLSANYGGGSDPNAIPTPADEGKYMINVNFLTNTYTVTKQ